MPIRLSSRPSRCAGALMLLTLAGCRGRTGPGAEAPSEVRPPEQVTEVAPVVAVDSSRVPRPVVIAGCVADQPRTSFAEIRWTTGPALAADSVQLDVTVFKDGFQAGRYGTLGPAREPRVQAYFRPETALRALSLANISRRRAGDTTVVRVERLEPGINYLWRVRTAIGGRQMAGATVRMQAPTCVADEPQLPGR